jgi:small subunit ribosomal protein S2
MDANAPGLTGLTLKDLLDSGLHFGHQTRRWNPKMRRYIFDKRNGIHIVDLTQSLSMLESAAAFLREAVLGGKRVLFVATKKQAQEVVKQAATAAGQFYVTERWLGGTLTNNQTIRRSVRRMRQIEAMARNNNGLLSVHKKEAASLRRELDKLQRNLSGVADMEHLPSALFVVDICREAIAVAEANRLGIPVVAIVDTNADPDPIDFVIPGNDDAIRAIKMIADALARVMKDASDEYGRLAAEKMRQQEAERAAAEAAARAARREAREGEAEAEAAKERLARQRRAAAKAAREAVAAARVSATPAAPAAAAAAATAAPAGESAAAAPAEPAAAEQPAETSATPA